MKTVKFTVPSFYTDFHCQADKCPETCCERGWNIEVDKNTYQLCKAVKDSEFNEDLEKYIKRNKKNTGHDNNYSRIVLDEKGVCPFLRDGLCSIQRKLGYKYLSVTCKVFPRLQPYKLGSPDSPMQAGLSMACRHVIRLGVLSPEPITFKEVELDIAKDIHAQIPVNLIGAGNRPPFGGYALEIQEICIAVMQCRTASIPDRIFVMGMVLHKLYENSNIENGLEGALKYVAQLISGQLSNAAGAFPDSVDKRLLMKQKVFETMGSFIHSGVFAGFNKTLSKRAEKDGKELQKLSFADLNDYTEEFAGLHWKGFLEKYSDRLENFFVNYIYTESFPFKYEGLSIYHHFITLAEMYATMRLVFNAESSEYGSGEISDAFFIDVINKIFQAQSHDNNAAERKNAYIETGTDSLAFISFLLRE